MDDRLDSTIENLVPTEEPHYQEPSSELIPITSTEPEYSVLDSNTYDTPRALEISTEKTEISIEEKVISNF